LSYRRSLPTGTDVPAWLFRHVLVLLPLLLQLLSTHGRVAEVDDHWVLIVLQRRCALPSNYMQVPLLSFGPTARTKSAAADFLPFYKAERMELDRWEY
jgi:hypothetical protein